MGGMERIEKASFYSVHCPLTLSATDEEVLSLLYLPIVKSDAYSLYHRLLAQAARETNEGYMPFDNLLSDLGTESFRVLQATRKLEGIGLLQTYRKEEKSLVLYLFRIVPPATPKKFFSDVVLSHLLRQSLGERRYQQTRFLFECEKEKNLGYQEVTTPFSHVYDLEEENTDEESNLSLEGQSYHPVSKFDFGKVLSLLSAEHPAFTKEEEKEISELSVLYGLDEKEAASLVDKNIDTAEKFYAEGFRKDIRLYHRFGVEQSGVQKDSSGNRLAQLMEKLSPAEYLSYRLNANPAPFMLDLIERLSRELGLSKGLINTAIDYSLQKTDGKFVESYIEKVCYTLKAQNIQSSYQAMVFLNDQDYQKKNAKKKSAAVKATEKKEDSAPEDEERMARLKKELRI